MNIDPQDVIHLHAMGVGVEPGSANPDYHGTVYHDNEGPFLIQQLVEQERDEYMKRAWDERENALRWMRACLLLWCAFSIATALAVAGWLR